MFIYLLILLLYWIENIVFCVLGRIQTGKSSLTIVLSKYIFGSAQAQVKIKHFVKPELKAYLRDLTAFQAQAKLSSWMKYPSGPKSSQAKPPSLNYLVSLYPVIM